MGFTAEQQHLFVISYVDNNSCRRPSLLHQPVYML